MLRIILPLVCAVLLVPVVSWAGENPNAKLAMHLIASEEYLECDDLMPAACESINVDVSLEELSETNGYGCIALLAYDVEGISGLEFALQGWPTGRGAPALDGPYWCFDGATTFGDHRDEGGGTGFGECAEPDSSGLVLVGYLYFGPVDSSDVPITFNFLPSTYTAPEDSILAVTDCTEDFVVDEVVASSGCTIGGTYSETFPDCGGERDGGGESGPGDVVRGDEEDSTGSAVTDSATSGGSGGRSTPPYPTIFSEFQSSMIPTDFVPGVVIVHFDPDCLDCQEGDTLELGTGILPDSLEDVLDSLNVQSVVKVFTGFTEADTLQRRRGREIKLANLCRFYELGVPDTSDIIGICWKLNYVECIWSAEPAPWARPCEDFPNDPYYSAQWDLWPKLPYDGDIEAETAWYWSTGESSGVVVGIIGSGIEYELDDFGGDWGPGKKVDGKVFYCENPPCLDINDVSPTYHGTKVAGRVGALTNNNHGLASIVGGSSPDSIGTRLFAMRCSRSEDGWVHVEKACDAMNHAAQHPELGIEVLSLTYGDYEYVIAQHAALGNVYEAGILPVASKGNENSSSPHFPSDHDAHWMLSVGATDRYARRWVSSSSEGSNWGNHIDVMAPGAGVYVVTPETAGEVDTDTGTSFAAPQVAGLAALIHSYHPHSANQGLELWPDDVQGIIKASAIDLDPSGYDDSTGYGLVNARRAIQHMRWPWRLFHCEEQGGTQYGGQGDPYTGYFCRVYAPGPYTFRTREVRRSVAFPVEFSGIPFVWGRGSYGATVGWNLANPQACTGFCQPVSGTITETGCVLKTYVYDVWDFFTQDYVGRFPCDVGENVFAYSVLGRPKENIWYDDCGDPAHEPHLIPFQGDDYTCPQWDDSLATMSVKVMGNVGYEYSGLWPEAIYTVTASVAQCDSLGYDVCQSVWADTVMLDRAYCVTGGVKIYGPHEIDPVLYAEDSTFQLIFKRDFPGEPLVPSATAVSCIWVSETWPIGAVPPESADSEMPELGLVVNYPNPFNPHTTISYRLLRASDVTLTIYDVRGRNVRTLVDAEACSPGRHSFLWNGKDADGSMVSSGIYFCRLEALGQVAVGKMVMLK